MENQHHRAALAIAGLGVDLRCHSAALAAELRRRYAPFPADGPERLQVELVPLVELPDALPTTDELVVRGALAHAAGPGYQGWIDVGHGRAWLSLAGDAAVTSADYFLRVLYALLAFDAGGLLVHAAGIERDGCAYLFLGPSGTGKTTVARNSPGARVLNDDLVLLMPSVQGWDVYATPFSNPSQAPPSSAAHAPLKALFRLAQDSRVFVQPLGAARATAELIAHAPLLPLDPVGGPALLRRARRIATAVPMQELHFLPDASFWQII